MLDTTIKVLVYNSSNLQGELLAAGLESLKQGITVKCLCDCTAISRLIRPDEKWVVLVSGTNTCDTASFARFMCSQFPHVPFVFLMEEGRHDRLVDAFRHGAKGIVYSTASLEQLARCIDRVSQGEVWIRDVDLLMLFEQLPTPEVRVTDVSGRVLLSRRQAEISRLVAEGMSNREVSHALHISEGTVKNSLFHVFDKLGISNRVELTRYINSAASREQPGVQAGVDA